MNNPWVQRLLRLAAFCPALLLGVWLVSYTQRQAARPPSGLDRSIAEASKEADSPQDPFAIDLELVPEVAEFEGFLNYGEPIASSTSAEGTAPHVIRVTSKRIEMPVFSTRKVSTKPPTPWAGETVAAASDRKGIEPLLADFIDRLSRNFGRKSPTPP